MSNRIGGGFDSVPEIVFTDLMEKYYQYKCAHCEDKFPYTLTIESTYNPDFIVPATIFTQKAPKTLLVCFEVKGRHRTTYDVLKAEAKARHMEDLGYIYIFVFQNPNVKMPNVKRKTVGKWAEENNFNFVSLTTSWDWKSQIKKIIELNIED